MDTEPLQPAAPQRRRRWFQFSLRTLMLFTLICAVGCCWLARRIEQKRKEREAVTAFEKHGGIVLYGDEIETFSYVGRTVNRQNPPGPAWLRSLLGENFFSTPRGLYFSPTMWGGYGSTMPATEANFAYLDDLAGVETMVLTGGATDEALAHLERHSSLRELDVSYSEVHDCGIGHLQGLTGLRELDLDYTRITNTGLVHLAGMSELQSLSVAATGVTDAGLGQLCALTSLRKLNLTNDMISDAGLKRLTKLRNLQELNVEGTNVSEAGAAEFQKSLPGCRIKY